MSWKNIAILTLLLSQVVAEINDKDKRLTYLNKLLWNINNYFLTETIIIIQHHRDTKCSLREWNPRRYPTFRVTEESEIMIPGKCNSNAEALICMTQYSHIRLLDTVAYAYKNIREERIILWLQATLTPNFLAKILDNINKFKFAKMIILETVHKDNELIKYHRLKLFPTPEFITIENALNLKGHYFYEGKFNMYGATLNVKSSDNSALYLPKKDQDCFPRVRVEDREIFELGEKYNISLKLVRDNQNNTENVDISLDTYFITKNTTAQMGRFSTPFSSASLLLIVPCRKEMRLNEIFKYMDFTTCFIHAICIYANRRIHGQTLGLTWIMIINLRAFSALLGMSFPIRRRTSLSLKHLFLAMSIFGMIFSSFFSCKLSSLMTKRSLIAQVTNMEELRASGLTVLADSHIRDFIETEYDAEYFHKTIPNHEFRPDSERHKLLLSLNNTYAQIIFKTNWPIFISISCLWVEKLSVLQPIWSSSTLYQKCI